MTTPTIPPNMVPWNGGDTAPEDWDREAKPNAMWRDGYLATHHCPRWSHEGGPEDIIAYTPRARQPTEPVPDVQEARIVAHFAMNDEPMNAMADAMVAGIEAWKLNDEAAIEVAMRAALDRIAKSVITALAARGPAHD